jgi:hypothetical protein
METVDDEKDSPLRRKILEANNKDDSDATKRTISMNQMVLIERYLREKKDAKTIDERIEYFEKLDLNHIDPELEKLGIKSAADRDDVIRTEESLKEFATKIADSPMMQRYREEVAKFTNTIHDIASIRSTIPGAEHWNIPSAMNQAKNNSAISNKPLSEDAKLGSFAPNFDLTVPKYPELKSLKPIIDLPKMIEDQWERHNQLLELQRDTYKILAADAKTNQDILDEQRRSTRMTGAVLAVGIVSTFGILWSVISQIRSLIPDSIAIGAVLMLAIAWVIVLIFLKRGSLLPKKAKAEQREAENAAN